MLKHSLLAGALCCALAAGACQTTALDGRIAEVSDRLAARCADLQAAALTVDLFAPEKVRSASRQAEAVLTTFCAKPPRTAIELTIAIAETLRALQAIETAKRAV